jgi:competence/damage-inducible protein CinA-like protein
VSRCAECIAIGSELLGPSRLDTNGLFLSRRLGARGIEVRYRTIVGDRIDDLRETFRIALDRADLVVATGGLGPTVDDLTREAVSELLGLPLVEDERILRGIEERFRRFGLAMPPSNRRQALVPRGAVVLPNRVGTAPGLFITSGSRVVALLPGVPAEMEAMVDDALLPLVPEEPLAFATRVFRVAGLTESETDRRLAGVHAGAGEVEWTILASPGQIEIHLRERVATGAPAPGIERLDREIAGILGEDLFGRDDESLESAVAARAVGAGATLAVAESVTGGAVAAAITSVAGASTWFLGGAVVYTDAAKSALAGVDPSLLASAGAVSAPVAAAMAEGMAKRLGARYGLATTGFAGPEGGGPDRPPGTIFLGLTGPAGTETRALRLPGARGVVQRRATYAALDLLRRRLGNDRP